MTLSFQKNLIVKQFQGNYLKRTHLLLTGHQAFALIQMSLAHISLELCTIPEVIEDLGKNKIKFT